MVAQSSVGRPGERGPDAPVALRGAVARTAAAVLGVCVLGTPLTAAARHHQSGHEDAKPGSEDKSKDKSKNEDPKAKEAAEDKLPSGPLMLSVSIGGQRVTVYDNGRPVASSQISSGMSGHATPTGIFSIIQKQKWHHSNLYSNAPMPYMQRITWSGVALHAGVVPGYPASHGCIRLPSGFAVHLYGMTRVGARVIVARGNTTPYVIEHPRLAALTTRPADKPADPDQPGAGQAGLSSSGAVVVATTGAVSDDSNHHDQAADPAAAGHAQNEGGEPQNEGPPGDAPPPSPPPADPGKGAAPPVDPLSRPGVLSLFVSRREGKLFVRKGFEPAFDLPVTITDPDKPLGNHIFTAAGRRPSEGGGIRWLAVSLGVDRSAIPNKDKKHKGQHAEAPDPRSLSAAALRQSALDALDRIELPPEALARLSPLVAPGTSLTISDHGLGPETGKETDFIVVTQ